jgi:hypothetical protein
MYGRAKCRNCWLSKGFRASPAPWGARGLAAIWRGLGTGMGLVPERLLLALRSPSVGRRSRRYPGRAMATRKVNLMLDEELIRRARRQDNGEADKSDVEVVEDALAVFLGLRALEDARAQGALKADEADRLAVQEVRAVRRARRQAA